MRYSLRQLAIFDAVATTGSVSFQFRRMGVFRLSPEGIDQDDLELYLIDHGAAMYFHHDWATAGQACEKPFVLIRDHVLLPFASRIAEVDAGLAARLPDHEIERIVSLVPSLTEAVEATMPGANSSRDSLASVCSTLRTMSASRNTV